METDRAATQNRRSDQSTVICLRWTGLLALPTDYFDSRSILSGGNQKRIEKERETHEQDKQQNRLPLRWRTPWRGASACSRRCVVHIGCARR